ncbi:MAG: glycosyltransferase [Crocinitomix sp.]|nr:glycosyltransferase [Crocinitomix sp.]
MKVLFISYFFDPYPGVGAKRTTYWANNLHHHGISCDVLTATEQVNQSKNITFLPPEKSSGLLRKLIKDQGLNWKSDLRAYFTKQANFDYDIVVFSGGPFMHFGVGAFLKKRFKCKVILDYRDPFSYNPRHGDKWLKKTLKSYFEKRFNKMADAVTTVNDICKAQMPYVNKVYVISNGFDDEILKSEQLNSSAIKTGQILNGGKLYSDFKMDALLQVIADSESLSFRQVGQENQQVDKMNNERISSQGFIPYNELLDQINQTEICTVLTGGKAFETPTKTYDYIALNKKILVITEGEVRSGGIQSILSNYPNAEWATNSEQAILEAIVKLQGREVKLIDNHPFSRAAGLEKLVDLFKTI